jgi:hypothetical protein
LNSFHQEKFFGGASTLLPWLLGDKQHISETRLAADVWYALEFCRVLSSVHASASSSAVSVFEVNQYRSKNVFLVELITTSINHFHIPGQAHLREFEFEFLV